MPSTPEFAVAEQASERFKATGSMVDLDAAIAAWDRVFTAPGFSQHSVHDRRWGLLTAGTAEFLRYKAGRRLADAAAAVGHLERALAVEAIDRPSELGTIYLKLSMVLAERHNHTGDLADLVRAAEIRRLLIDDLPEGDQTRSSCVIGLARMLTAAAQAPGREGVALDLRIAALVEAFNEISLHGTFWSAERAEICFHMACACLYAWQHSPVADHNLLRRAHAASQEAEMIFTRLDLATEAGNSAELGRRIARHLAADQS